MSPEPVVNMPPAAQDIVPAAMEMPVQVNVPVPQDIVAPDVSVMLPQLIEPEGSCLSS
jgi:hypothetical protein